MEPSAPPAEVLNSVAAAASGTKPSAKPASLAQLQSALAGKQAAEVFQQRQQALATSGAQETRQLKEQAYQLNQDWRGNSAVTSRTSHGGTEKALLQKILAQLAAKRQRRSAAQMPRAQAKGPQGPTQGPQKTNMMDQMQNGGNSETSKSNGPAAHELPLGE